MLMIDYDNTTLEHILKILPTNLRYRIYKTYNGYHVFVISQLISYNSEFSITLSKNIGCDEWYIIFFKYNGYCIRLTPKLNRSENSTHEFIMNYGNGNINSKCLKMIKIFESKMFKK